MAAETGIRILVTRPLSEEQIAYANSLGLAPVIFPALTIEYPHAWQGMVRKIANYPDLPWVFTSRNGVGALQAMLSEYRITPPAGIFAVGEKTAAALADLGIEASVPRREDAVGLARLIIDESTSGAEPHREPGAGGSQTGTDTYRKILHWCGNRSRDELAESLREAGIERVPLEVYHTELNTMDLPGDLGHAILFYSPSAVEAFRRSGGFRAELPPLFAIGNTTAEALALESGGNVHIPSRPSTEALLELTAKTVTAVTE